MTTAFMAALRAGERVDRSFQTAEWAEPARPDAGIASDA
jgi:hypothetical protein